jgi:hypothetical protein
MFEYIDKKRDAKKVYLNYLNDILKRSGLLYEIIRYSESIDQLYIIIFDKILKNEIVIKYTIHNEKFALWIFVKNRYNKYKILRDHIADELLKITFEYMTKFNRSKSFLKNHIYYDPKFWIYNEED